MSDKEEKSKGAKIGEAIQRVREFGEEKDLPEETIKDFIKSDIEEIREEDDEKPSTEVWLGNQPMGSGERPF
jgi:hypothetical protein